MRQFNFEVSKKDISVTKCINSRLYTIKIPYTDLYLATKKLEKMKDEDFIFFAKLVKENKEG